jgi:hypothetical protein
MLLLSPLLRPPATIFPKGSRRVGRSRLPGGSLFCFLATGSLTTEVVCRRPGLAENPISDTFGELSELSVSARKKATSMRNEMTRPELTM